MNLKKYRILKGYTQKELAEIIGIQTRTLQKYESGEITPPLEKLIKLVDALGITLNTLYDGNIEGALKDFQPINESLISKENINIKNEKYFLEQYLHSLGADIIYDEKDGYIVLKYNNNEYEISNSIIEDLEKSTETFIKFKLHEITSQSRKIGEK